jgi:hypothetical protein
MPGPVFLFLNAFRPQLGRLAEMGQVPQAQHKNMDSHRQLKQTILEPIPKMHLTLNSGVTDLLKMLKYSNVCYAFSSADALLLSVICYF